MKIAIDAMSGDLGSAIVVEACLSFLQTNKTDDLYVVGKIEELKALENNPQVTLVDARDVLEMTENILAIRRKKESSMVKTMLLAKKGEVDAVVSCGNTGAYYASAMLFLKRIKGIEKSCLMAQLPTMTGGKTLLLDVGANSENTAEQLLSFGIMGTIYSKSILKADKPKVALLNIGSEEHKGDEVHHQANALLAAHPDINFVGNIEGKEIISGKVDVIVTDGFSGNIALKTIEGTAGSIMKALKESLMGSMSGKIGAVIAKNSFKELKKKFDTEQAGGALLVGFERPVIKAHGASSAFAFENAIALAKSMVENKVVDKMKEGLGTNES